jgi:hypothetical protein
MTDIVVHHAKSANDLTDLHIILRPLIGQLVWKVRLGYGDELKFSAGDHVPYTHPRMKHLFKGEWNFGGRASSWYITSTDENESKNASDLLDALNNTGISDIQLLLPHLNLVITFSNGYTLYTTPDPELDTELAQWELFTPDDMVLEVGFNGTWTYRSAKA